METVAQILFNDILPPKYRDYKRNFSDTEMVPELLERMAKELPPDEYKDILREIFDLGGNVSYYEGASFNLQDLRTPQKTKDLRQKVSDGVQDILRSKHGTKEDRNKKIIDYVSKHIDPLKKSMMDESTREGNGLTAQAVSKSRGSAADLQSLMIGDMLMRNANGEIIPIPILHGYAEGIDPAEYWANTYGTRQGLLDVKLSVADSGFAAKKMKHISHKIVVTEQDCGTSRNIEVDTKDADNVGVILSTDVGDYKAGTPLTANMLKEIDDKTVHVRSPLTCQSDEGICATCAGVRENGTLPNIGENLGIPASQSVSEKTTQKALSSKHSSGRTSGKEDRFINGFKLIEQLIDVPKSFVDAATITSVGGRVDKIEDAPQGGKLVHVGGEQFYVPSKMDVTVALGEEVEAGDLLSDGIPDPSEMVLHKGIGETRRMYMDQLRKATGANRRNVEIMGRGFVDFVKVTDPDLYPNVSPDDIMRYSKVEKNWKSREGFRNVTPNLGIGKYLEQPIAHYTIGTKITKKVASELSRKGHTRIDVHDDEPPFQPLMVPSVRALMNEDDWQVRMGGYHLKDSLLDAATKGMSSSFDNTSYIPAIMKGTGFGDRLDSEGLY